MHDMDWNDLRYLLLLARKGSFAAAGRALGIDPTTVARRLRATEAVLKVRLFERGAAGEMRPTQAGDIAIRRAEAIEAEVGGLSAAVRGADMIVSGTVRMTAVPVLINRVLIPAIPRLTAQHPGLRIELVADTRGLNLTRREADIALRLARPEPDIGARVVAKRIGTLHYAAYAAKAARRKADALPWLTYEDGMAHLPPARWIAKVMAKDGGLAAVALNDADSLLHAVAAGLGRSLLPCIVGDSVKGIGRVAIDGPPLPEREIWLLTHADLRPLARIGAVLGWIETTLGR
nr:LysR family transcriptional regulator [uncultured Dongia sp.]